MTEFSFLGKPILQGHLHASHKSNPVLLRDIRHRWQCWWDRWM